MEEWETIGKYGRGTSPTLATDQVCVPELRLLESLTRVRWLAFTNFFGRL
jgi:hypothetical protein